MGFAARLAHFLEEAEPGPTSELDAALRWSSGRLGLKGTVVGMSSNFDLRSQKIVNAINDEASGLHSRSAR